MQIRCNKINVFVLIVVFFSMASCKKTPAKVDDLFSGNVVVYPPKSITPKSTKRIYVHLMPWFETKETNQGKWGIHWTMATKNPDVLGANGKRQIASHFYPLIGPYASGDPFVIEYQLLLMKYSGIDVVLIDWPGTMNKYDYPLLVRNTEKFIAQLEKVGLSFAIVYEDQNLVEAGSSKLTQAQNDMAYLQSTYFIKPQYEKINSKPLLLTFGPQILKSETEWTTTFSGLSPKPEFYTLWYQSKEAGVNASGEFSWIYQDYLSGLNNFYTNGYTGKKIAAAYPGFKTYYSLGGWTGPTWAIDHNGTSTFESTLTAALSSPLPSVQLVTWNDYGEGTMIEPTDEFGYKFLTMLQSKLGITAYSINELQAIYQLYQKRNSFSGDPLAQKKLDQVFYYFVSLQSEKAIELLNSL